MPDLTWQKSTRQTRAEWIDIAHGAIAENYGMAGYDAPALLAQRIVDALLAHIAAQPSPPTRGDGNP